MKVMFCLAAALALSSCVEPPDLTDTRTQALATCTSSLTPAKSEAMPTVTDWTQGVGVLPPDSSTKMAWIMTAVTANPQGDWYLHQVDLANVKVNATIKFTAVQKPTMLGLVGNKNQALGGIRVPPGPIGPGGTGWSQAKFMIQLADRMFY